MLELSKTTFKLFVNDKGKFAALLIGIICAVFLMVTTTPIFTAVLQCASSVYINIGAKM